MERASWSSRSAFILAAVGSAVGLGNAWRFPGLVAKHGGGTFLVVYLVAMFVIGIPLLMMEISIGRKTRSGAPGAMRAMNKKFEPIGWAATANAFVITTYYAVVFAWVLAMAVFSFKFAGMTGDTDAASNLFATLTQTSWTVSDYGIPMAILGCLAVAWVLIYVCIRDGANSVSKVVKYTVFLPVICLGIMAIKGITMPGGMEGVAQLFIPDVAAFQNTDLWLDAIGQVFFSLSIMMAIMFAYGSFLDDESNIAVDAIIIAVSDMAISVLAGIVMFSTMGGVGMLDSMSDSGIVTAFIVYPQAIVSLTGNGVVNAIFGFIFYMCLVTLAIDSAFSIVEGVSTAVADKFKIKHSKVTIGVCIAAAVVSLLYATRAGLAWLDIVDNWTNQYSMIVIGILECVAVGWFFDPKKVLAEINRNTKSYKMPAWWFVTSIKVIAPVILAVLLGFKFYSLFVVSGGNYGGYPMWAICVGGWLVMALCFVSGFVVKAIVASKKKAGFVEDDRTWDEL
ncbi:MAG: sodium-dependent transporter [Eubacteriales bacterium]